jgi:hypothetical protein
MIIKLIQDDNNTLEFEPEELTVSVVPAYYYPQPERFRKIFRVSYRKYKSPKHSLEFCFATGTFIYKEVVVTGYSIAECVRLDLELSAVDGVNKVCDLSQPLAYQNSFIYSLRLVEKVD